MGTNENNSPLHFTLQCDGGSRGNPGRAGTGSTLMLPDGQEIGCVWEFLKHATNNVAEYTGLINGLVLAGEIAEAKGLSARDVSVDVKMDSKLVVEQMNGRWKIKHPDMKPLGQRVKELERGMAKVTYTWVPRAENERTDELANRAMDDGESGQWIDEELIGAGGDGDADSAGDQASGAGANGADPAAGAGNGQAMASPSSAWHGQHRPTRLLLLRHGQTSLNRDGKFSGQGNPDLTNLGRDQAERAAAYIGRRGGIGAIVTSPLQRCVDTAEACADALGMPRDQIQVIDDLKEMDFGTWEARTFEEVQTQWPDEHRECLQDSASAPHGGESSEQVYQRVSRVVDDIIAEHPGMNVLVVTHMTPIKSVLRHALGCGGEIYRSLHLDVASLSIAEFFPSGHGVVRLVNATHYLD